MTALIPVRRLLDRLRHGPERARDLDELRARYAAELALEDADPEDVALAKRLLELREALSRQLASSSVAGCRSCAKGHPLPYGRWSGGHCCGSRTEVLFTRDELLSQKLAGVTLAGLVPPRSEQSGCAFRGPEGCSLAARNRPNLCVAYTCRDLERELAERDDSRELFRLQAELRSTFDHFVARQRVRRDAEHIGEPDCVAVTR